MRRWLHTTIFRIVRWYFIGKELHWIGMAGVTPIYRGKGKIISGRIESWDGIARNLTLFWLPEGMPEIAGLREATLTSVRFNQSASRWEFHDVI